MTVVVSADFVLTGFDASRLKARIPVILRQYDKVLYPAFKAEISAKQFPWPNITARSGKAALKAAGGRKNRIYNVVEVESPRDIVDTGAFRASQQRRTEGNTGTQLVYSWGNSSVPYALMIFQGYTTKSGTTLPGRDWITPALEKNPLDKFFREEWARLSNRSL
tara:strand:- start:259 stop:750 length:492 start_codon:yes stop_codon:yes gene_type:complete